MADNSPTTELPKLGTVCRLGLATRGDTGLTADDVHIALEHGVNYLNWCGVADGLRDCIRGLGERRRQVKVAIQLEARTADAARREIDGYLQELNTDYLDVVTYYYVEHPDEWREIVSPGGAAEAMADLRRQGTVRVIGLTSHQRPLAAEAAANGRLDLLMIRYNAAHRGAERDVFPTTTRLGMPVVAFTCLRWGALLRGTPNDPPGFVVPAAPDWYRFVLAHPAVSIALMAPNSRRELLENLSVITYWRELGHDEHALLLKHGDRVRRHAAAFP